MIVILDAISVNYMQKRFTDTLPKMNTVNRSM
jgi:hypothetical protein